MMVYGKEESADTLIEQLSKDRGAVLCVLESACVMIYCSVMYRTEVLCIVLIAVRHHLAA
jgi:hypothetical protein